MRKILLLIGFLTLIGCSYDVTLDENKPHNEVEKINIINPTISLYLGDSVTIFDVMEAPSVKVSECRLINNGTLNLEISDHIKKNGVTVFCTKLLKEGIEYQDGSAMEVDYVVNNDRTVHTISTDDITDIRIKVEKDEAIPIFFNVTVDGWNEINCGIN